MCEPLNEGYKPLLFCDLLWLCLKFFASWTNQENGQKLVLTLVLNRVLPISLSGGFLFLEWYLSTISIIIHSNHYVFV